MRSQMMIKRSITRLNQEELAAIMNVPQGAIAQLETKMRPQRELVNRIGFFLPLRKKTITLYDRIINLSKLYKIQFAARKISKLDRPDGRG